MKKFLLCLAAAAAAIALISCANDNSVTSPDGRIRTTVSIDDGGVPALQVDVDGKALISASELGLEADGLNLASGFAVTGVARDRRDETWTQPWGENKVIRDRHEEMAVTMRNSEGVTLVLRVRAFDDGIGFRYEYDTPADSLRLTDEHTTFRFAQNGLSWSIDGNYDTYELPYREQPVSAVERANTPFTFRCGGLYGSIHEAALYDYPEMHLLRQDSLAFKAELAPLPDGVKARLAGSFTTPWRTLQIADRAVGLINSSLILNLNEPSKIADTSWIRPQKYVGVWWGMHLGTQVWTMGPRHGATTENAIRHIDFAAANDIQGVLFEGWNRGWENWGGNQQFDYVEPYADFDLERIARYAAEKGIELWMHNETGGNIPDYEAHMERAMQRYAELGIHTLKTGYAGGFKGGYSHHSQYGVQHYQRVVELAAKYRIMLDVHEPIKETGIRRTWPNMMTREGARGMEWNAWSEGNSAEYLCTLPFVRLLSGPMDYTPGTFSDSQHPHITSYAHELALTVLFESGIQHMPDRPEAYKSLPDVVKSLLKRLPTAWDDTKLLAGYPGESAVVARKKGNDWYIAGVNGKDSPASLRFSLKRLELSSQSTAVLICDGHDDRSFRIQEKYVPRADGNISVSCLARGGFVMVVQAKGR